MDTPRSGAEDSSELQRARTLLRILPAQVHRLRNALAVVQGVCELAAQGQPRVDALARLALLNATLERLALLARVPATRTQALALEELFADLELLLRPLERSGMALELACDGPAFTHADGQLALHLLDLCAALASGAPPGERRRLRLHARVTSAGIRLVLAVQGPTLTPQTFEALTACARARGWPCALRCARQRAAVRLYLPALAGSPLSAPRARDAAQRILLVHRGPEERELLAAVLAEHGHVVEAHAQPPEAGTFALALVERRLAQEDPELPRRLGTRLGLARVELLDERLGPDALLALVSPRA